MCIFFCVPVFFFFVVVVRFFFFCGDDASFSSLFFFFHSTLTVVLSPARACLPFSFLFLISKSTEKQTTAKTHKQKETE